MSEVQSPTTAVMERSAPAARRRSRHPSEAFPRLRALPTPGSDADHDLGHGQDGADRAGDQPLTKVTVFARDVVLRAGITNQLQGRDDLMVLEERGVVADSVALVVADELDDEVISAIRA